MEKTTSARAVIKNKEITGAPIMGGLTGLIGLLCGSFCAFNSFNPVGAAYIMAFAGEGVSLPAAAMTVCAAAGRDTPSGGGNDRMCRIFSQKQNSVFQ